MAYLDVISLNAAKLYLRVDDTLTEDDTQITLMIETALQYVENWTNVLVFARAKTYRLIGGCLRVYDFPINALVDPVDAESEEMTLYSFYSYGSVNYDLVLNVGYQDPANVPQGLKEVAFELIGIMYYQHETDKKLSDLSDLSVNILNQNKRFIL